MNRKIIILFALMGSLSFWACGNNDGNSSDTDNDAGDTNLENGDDDLVVDCQTPANRVLWKYQSPGPDTIYFLADVNDVNDDDVADIAVATKTTFLNESEDYLFVLSGAAQGTGEKIWGAKPLSSTGTYTATCSGVDDCIMAAGDLNQNDYPDFLFAAAGGSRTLFALDGQNGSIIWEFDVNLQDEDGSIHQISLFNDLDDDGIGEVLFVVGSPLGTAFLVSGADGRVFWSYEFPDSAWGATMIGDLDGDLIEDAIITPAVGVGAEEYNVVALSGNIKGTSGEVLYDQEATVIWTHDIGSTAMASVPLQDINNDLVPDLAVAVWGSNVYGLSGADGSELWTREIRNSSTLTGIIQIGDVDGDGFNDLAIEGDTDGLVILGGQFGNILWRGATQGYAWYADRLNDFNNDGVDEVVEGSFDNTVRVYSGKDGTVLWTFSTGTERIYSMQATRDIDGDGAKDVIVGTQNDRNNTDSGMVYLLSGCP